MKNCVKKLLVVLGCVILSQISKNSIAFAAEDTIVKSTVPKSVVCSTSGNDVKNDDSQKNEDAQKNANEAKNVSELPKDVTANVLVSAASTKDVPVDKSWKIKFNQQLDPSSLKGKIKIVNKDTGAEVSSYLSLGEDNTLVTISSHCDSNSNYSLVIDKDIKSKYNKELKDSVSIDFKTVAAVVPPNETASTDPTKTDPTKTDTVVNFTDSINLTAKVNEKVTLPANINGTTADGKTVQVKVSWNQPVIYAEEVGTYTYYGAVEGSSKKVSLNLTITPADNTNQDSGDVKSHSELQKSLYNYLMASADNRQSVMNRAVELHGGDLANNCVYFASEALRRAGLTDLSEGVCNTNVLTNELSSRGWLTSDNLDELEAGDICFTISYGSGPTHTYTFMKWVDSNDHGYAYICDNQGSDYDGDPYHKRNINFQTPEKDRLAYFMYKPGN